MSGFDSVHRILALSAPGHLEPGMDFGSRVSYIYSWWCHTKDPVLEQRVSECDIK